MCTLVFPPQWPLRAPRPYLRETFPLDLPHINPHLPGNLVSPCVFEGSLDELLHRFGLDAIVDQVIDWLTKAAAGTLIDLSQGWEPTRRDDCPSMVVFSAERICQAAPTDGGILVSRAGYATIGKDGIYAMLAKSLYHDPSGNFHQELKGEPGAEWGHGGCAVFTARAPFVDGKAPIFAQYRPETVNDLDSLLLRASELGINSDVLGSAIHDYYTRCVLQSKQNPREWRHGLFAIVILLVQRPAPLITARNRSIEVLPYVISYEIDVDAVFNIKADVHPAFHAHELSPQLLAQASDHSLELTVAPLTLLGCGSLGSKIGLHLARAGFGKLTLVDNEIVSPHNLARHALLDTDSEHLLPKKADLMGRALAKLSHDEVRSFHMNAVDVFSSVGRLSQVVDQNAVLIIDATASLEILAAASASAALISSGARLVRSVLYGQGRCAALLLEGNRRTARVDDLTALLFERCRSDSVLRQAIAGDSSEPTRIFVGDNCRSLTAPMSDAVVSRSAASIAIQIERWLTGGLPSCGVMMVGAVDEAGIGMSWISSNVLPVTVLAVSDDGGWQVRVLPDVAAAIDADARHWDRLETGGALIGCFSYELRTITVVGLVDLPPDSMRSAAKFILGAEGLTNSLRIAHADSLGHLSFIGTWHSHPTGGWHSNLDRETLARIAGDFLGRPAVSLVWTPNGMHCAVGRL